VQEEILRVLTNAAANRSRESADSESRESAQARASL
jgi:hypothetical protein